MMSSPARPSLPFSLPSLLALCCALGGASALQVGAVAAPRPSARAGAVTMGGFEQKSVPMAAGERVSLQLSGEHGSLSALSEACRTAAKEGALTGIIYDLQRLGRLEVIAEGAREQLEALVRPAKSWGRGGAGRRRSTRAGEQGGGGSEDDGARDARDIRQYEWGRGHS